MTLIDYAKRVFRYGPKGLKIWADIKLGEFKSKRFLIKNAKTRKTKTERGVTLVGPFSGPGSLSKTMRDLLLSVHETGIPYQTFSGGGEEDPTGSNALNLLTPMSDFNIRKYSLVLDFFNGIVPNDLVPNIATIIFWEFEDGFLPVYPAFKKKKHVVGMSDFVVDIMRNQLPSSTKVSKLLYPFRHSFGNVPDRMEMRKRFGIPEDAFVVFFNFNFASGFARKNPDGAMRAFAAAFRNDPHAFLLFKTSRADEFRQRAEFLSRLATELGIQNRFAMINDHISSLEIYGLTNACDAYLSLHRGEGFGLGVAEAMSLGVPVVVSDYSATTEFCNKENSMPVPCKVVAPAPGQNDYLTYSYVTKWAEPDISAAADCLRRIRTDSALREQIKSNAKRYIAEHFSPQNFKASLESLLDSLPTTA